MCYNIGTVKERSVKYATYALGLDTVPAFGGHRHPEQPRTERQMKNVSRPESHFSEPGGRRVLLRRAPL
jgi:hypothetical protein